MIIQNTIAESDSAMPTLWGLEPTQLHDRFWAARGVQVVRVGRDVEVVKDAELFLLMAPDLLAVFRLHDLIEKLSWLSPDVMWVRIHHERDRDYRETVTVGDSGEFVAFNRLYGGSDTRLARVALTPSREVARLWQSCDDAITGWRELRQFVARQYRASANITGRTYDRSSGHEVMAFMHDLIQTWHFPAATINRARKVAVDLWADTDANVSKSTSFIGPVWIGAAREVSDGETIVGPAVLWDDPQARPNTEQVEWEQLEPSRTFTRPARSHLRKSPYLFVKRILDLVLALVVLALVWWIFPLIMLGIYLEDGRPWFFRHARESKGGRTFFCLKFRSMCKEADQIKQKLVMENQVDGPQFFIKQDPRVTRVGAMLRRLFLDELPQLFNVLAGEMSIVGPRPSPHVENQFCPSWREARLSVLPGMTGLWQVMRTREPGKDFQEWIKYDIQYVENISFLLDLRIVWKTFIHCICSIRG